MDWLKNPNLLALTATIIYAFQGLLLEQKFSKYSSSFILLFDVGLLLPIFTVQFYYFYKTSASLSLPDASGLKFMILAVILYAVAENCSVNSYTLGGNLATLSVIYSVVPIFAILMKCLYTGVTPNLGQATAAALALIAVYIGVNSEVK